MEKLLNDSNRVNLGKTFESIRHEKGLSKSDFAKQCGIAASFYSDIIHNKKSLNFTTLEDICNRIDVPIYIFIFKSFNESSLEEVEDQKFIRELRPIVDDIVNALYGSKKEERSIG